MATPGTSEAIELSDRSSPCVAETASESTPAVAPRAMVTHPEAASCKKKACSSKRPTNSSPSSAAEHAGLPKAKGASRSGQSSSSQRASRSVRINGPTPVSTSPVLPTSEDATPPAPPESESSSRPHKSHSKKKRPSKHSRVRPNGSEPTDVPLEEQFAMIRDLIDKPEEPYTASELLSMAIAYMLGHIFASALGIGSLTLITSGTIKLKGEAPYVTAETTFFYAAAFGAVFTAPLPGLLIFIFTELPGRVSLRRPLVWIESRLGLPEWYPESWEPQGVVRLADGAGADAEAQQPVPKKFNRGFNVYNVWLTVLYAVGGILGNPPLGAYFFLKFGWPDGSITVWHAFMCGVWNISIIFLIFACLYSYNYAFRYCNGGRDLCDS